MSEDELYRPLNSQGMNVFDIMEFHGMTGPVKIVKDVLVAKNAGCKTVVGYEMFLHLAIECDKIWFPQLCDGDPAELYKVAERGFHRCD